MRIVIAILLAIVLLAGAIMWINNAHPNFMDQEIDQGETNDEAFESIDSIETYEAETVSQFHLSIDHPATTTVSKSSESLVALKYLGPDNQPNTEMTDGYYVTVEFIEEGDVEAYAQSESAGASVETMRFNDQDALTYTNQTALGTMATHIVYMPVDDSGWIVDISYTVFGQQSEEYEREVLNILNSIEINPL